MGQLIVRKVEEQLVQRLKELAGREGISMEEAHRRILREVLLDRDETSTSFKEILRSMPDVGKDEDFDRGPQPERKIEL